MLQFGMIDAFEPYPALWSIAGSVETQTFGRTGKPPELLIRGFGTKKPARRGCGRVDGRSTAENG